MGRKDTQKKAQISVFNDLSRLDLYQVNIITLQARDSILGSVGMQAESEDLYKSGYENATDADRIYRILEELQHGEPLTLLPVEKPADSWSVVFQGKPSLFHAARIAYFKEFLASQTHSALYVAAGKLGSVEIVMVPANDDEAYRRNSAKLLGRKEFLAELAKELWISEVSFGGKRVTFDLTV